MNEVLTFNIIIDIDRYFKKNIMIFYFFKPYRPALVWNTNFSNDPLEN